MLDKLGLPISRRALVFRATVCTQKACWENAWESAFAPARQGSAGAQATTTK